MSGGNFFLNAALARSLDASAYGCFATAFVCALFVTMLHNGALLDPISILAPSRKDGIDPVYVGAQLRNHLRSTSRLAGVPLLFALATYWGGADPRLPLAFLASGVTLPFVLLLPLARRILLVGGHLGAAAASGVTYVACMVTGYWLLSTYAFVSVATAYVLQAVASLLGAWILLRSYRWTAVATTLRAAPANSEEFDRRTQARSLVPAAILTFAITQLQLPMIGMLQGSAEAGLYRAMQLPALAIGQVMAAATTLALPWLAAAFGSGDLAGFRSRTRWVLIVLILIAGTAELVLIGTYPWVSALLYGRNYSDSSWLMPVLGLVGLTSAAGTALGVALRASRQSHLQLRAIAIMAGFGAPMAIVGTLVAGVTGAAVSSVVNYLLLSLINLRLYSVSVGHSPVGAVGPAMLAPKTALR